MRHQANSRAIAVGPSVPLLLRGQQAVANWAPHGFAEPEHALYQQILALNHRRPDHRAGDRGGIAGSRVWRRGDGRQGRATDQPKATLRVSGAGEGSGRNAEGAGRTADRGAGHRRLGHAHGADQPPGAAADATRYRDRRAAHRSGRRLGADGGAGHDGVRPHRADQRHQRHRSWHRDGRVPRRWRGRGRPVVANWPGLAPGQLFENRDLAPTTDLRAVAQGILVGHLGLSQTAMAAVFPGGEPAQPERGLVRTA